MMSVLVIKLVKHSECIDAEVIIGRGAFSQSLGWLYGLSLKDVEWLVLSNTSENNTPFIVEVPAS